MNPGTVLQSRMTACGLNVAQVAHGLGVPVLSVVDLLDGSSPDDNLLALFPSLFGLSAEFWTMLYSAPSVERSRVLDGALSDGVQAA